MAKIGDGVGVNSIKALPINADHKASSKDNIPFDKRAISDVARGVFSPFMLKQEPM